MKGGRGREKRAWLAAFEEGRRVMKQATSAKVVPGGAVEEEETETTLEDRLNLLLMSTVIISM